MESELHHNLPRETHCQKKRESHTPAGESPLILIPSNERIEDDMRVDDIGEQPGDLTLYGVRILPLLEHSLKVM